jgi:hypothetical protein
MIDCPGCCTRVEIKKPNGTVTCERCHETINYNAQMTAFRFGQLKRKAREEFTGQPYRNGRIAKYKFTPEMDEEIQNRYDSQRNTIKFLAEKFGFPEHTIKMRARHLGVTRDKGRRWTSHEERFLKNNLCLLSWSRLRVILGHSETAIRLKAKRLQINKSDEGYTMRGLCEMLGVDHHKIRYWLSLKWLSGQRRGSERRFDFWYFDPAEVRNFILRHPHEINIRRVEPLSFIEMLTGCEIQDETFVSQKKVS